MKFPKHAEMYHRGRDTLCNAVQGPEVPVSNVVLVAIVNRIDVLCEIVSGFILVHDEIARRRSGELVSHTMSQAASSSPLHDQAQVLWG